jgi:subtilase family serine protease
MYCKSRSFLPAACLICLLATLSGAAFAGSDAPTLDWLNSTVTVSSRVTAASDDKQLVTLQGNLHPLARSQYDAGRVNDAMELKKIMLLLQRSPEQEVMLEAVIDGQHNPKSPLFHHWMTPEQFGEHFGPSDHDIAAVTGWLQSQGFTIDEVSKGRTLIFFSGTAGQVRQAFHTEIHNLKVNGESHIANMSEPQIPAALAPVIAGFPSLNDFFPKPQHEVKGYGRRDPITRKVYAEGPMPQLTDSDDDYHIVGPQDFYVIYNEKPLLTATPPINGAGVTVAVAEQSDVCAGQSACNGNNDDNMFRAAFALPTYPASPNATQGGVNYMFGVSGSSICSDPGITANGDTDEASADLQWAGAVAPNATIDFVACAGTSTAPGTAFSILYILNSLSSTVASFSLSYGACELNSTSSTNSAYVAAWQQAAGQGQTVIVSSGDGGSALCDLNNGKDYATQNVSVNVLGSSAYNVSAGGTDFSDVYQTNDFSSSGSDVWWDTANSNGYLSALSYIPEITWGGRCSSPLVASYFENTDNETYGTTYTPEAICNNAAAQNQGLLSHSGGTGGVSTFNLIPSWQSVYGIGLNNTSAGHRNDPDVSLFASDHWSHGLTFCESYEGANTCDFGGASSGNFPIEGGTSFVAPMLNGVMALIVQAQAGAYQGNANTVFYSLAAGEYGAQGGTFTGSSCSGSGLGASVGSSCIFRDIAGDTPNPGTSGGTITSDNAQPCLPSSTDTDCYLSVSTDTYGITSLSSSSFVDAYQVGQGYDLGTGLGSVNIANLVKAWPTTNSLPSLSVSCSTCSASVVAGSSATFTFTVNSSSSTFSGTASLACGSGTEGLPTGVSCSFSPSSVTAYPTTVTVTVSTTSTTTAASDTVVVTASASGAYSGTQSGTLTVTSTTAASLSLTPSASSTTIVGGSSGTVTLSLNGSSVSSATVSCSGSLPADATCTPSPSTVTSFPATITITVTTTSADAQLRKLGHWSWAAFAMLLPGLLWLSDGRIRRRRLAWMAAVLVLLAVGFAGCGGGSSSTPSQTTPPSSQTYTETVTATGSGITSSATITVTVTK